MVIQAEEFWQIFSFLKRPDQLPQGTNIQLVRFTVIIVRQFVDGIKPMWEDEANKNGGRWTLKVSKGYANKLWEDLILAIIGEQFTLENEINGIVLSIRGQGEKISIWNRNGNNKEIVEKIKQDIVSILELPETIMMDYHIFNYPAESKSKATPLSTRQLKPVRV